MHRLLGKGSTSEVREAHGFGARLLRRFGPERFVVASEQDHWLRLAVGVMESVVPPLHCPLQ